MSSINDRLEGLGKRKVSVIAALALVSLLAALAIWSRSSSRERRNEVVGEATITSGEYAASSSSQQLIPHDIAIERLAYVMCSHEAACAVDNIDHPPFMGDAECSRDQRMGLAAELDRAEACVLGVDALALDRCVAEIETEVCGPTSRAPRSLALCRASVLCPHP